MKKYYFLILLSFFSLIVRAQDEKKNLGDKEYIIVKDYLPVLGESFKISDTPEGDSASATPPVMEYNVRSRKAETEFETSVIKAVKIRDEALAKLYRTYIKLGIGNYTTYSGDLYVNALRSKKGAVGLALNHLSGSPGLKNAGYAGFSENHGGVYGKYFLDHSTFGGGINYNRDVVHYYGYEDADSVIKKDDIKQRFNKLGLDLNFGSNNLNKDNINYTVNFGYNTIKDLASVTENDFMLSGNVGKQFDSFYLNGLLSLNYFKKSLSNTETVSLYNDLNRNIVTFIPTIDLNQGAAKIKLGVNLTAEKNLETDVHLFPAVDVTIPVAENILYFFAGANGGVLKNSFQTIVKENPYVTSEVIPFNTINKLELKAGVNGNFSKSVSFLAMVKYTTFDRLQLYFNDLKFFNKFNIIYADGNVLNMHAELSYRSEEKFSASLRFDQYSYDIDGGEKAWHRPNTEAAIDLKYNLLDKIIVNASLYARGNYPVRITTPLGFTSENVKGFVDGNIGIEYRYSKILSLYINFNNLGFSRYYYWYKYPSERLNVLGGLSYSF